MCARVRSRSCCSPFEVIQSAAAKLEDLDHLAPLLQRGGAEICAHPAAPKACVAVLEGRRVEQDPRHVVERADSDLVRMTVDRRLLPETAVERIRICDQVGPARDERVDVTRAENRHVGFGLGPHFCLGAALTRLETTIALRTLVQRFPGLRVATPTVWYRADHRLRGVESLPVVLGPERS